MENLAGAVQSLPEYFSYLMSGRNLVWFVLALFVYLICLFLNGTFVSVLRIAAVTALAADAVISCVVYRNYPHALIECAAIALMIAVRLITKGVLEARLARKNRRFERVALARAAMRRGEHKRDFGTAVSEGNGEGSVFDEKLKPDLAESEDSRIIANNPCISRDHRL